MSEKEIVCHTICGAMMLIFTASIALGMIICHI